jgi:hypothetical protein
VFGYDRINSIGNQPARVLSPPAGVREANVRKPTKTRVAAFLADGVPEQPRSIEIACPALCDLQEQAETVMMLADGRGSHEPI